MSFHLKYMMVLCIGQKILKLWRQKSLPFGLGWAAYITRICLWTFRFPCPCMIFSCTHLHTYHHSSSASCKWKLNLNRPSRLPDLQTIAKTRKALPSCMVIVILWRMKKNDNFSPVCNLFRNLEIWLELADFICVI